MVYLPCMRHRKATRGCTCTDCERERKRDRERKRSHPPTPEQARRANELRARRRAAMPPRQRKPRAILVRGLWGRWSCVAMDRLAARALRAQASPWARKAGSLASTCRRRPTAREPQRRRPRITWDDMTEASVEALAQRFAVHRLRQDPWGRWSWSKASVLNRRTRSNGERIMVDKISGSITQKNIRALAEAQGYRCAVSGAELTPDTATVDHIVPLSRGGPHGLANLHVVHKQIQKAKGSMTLPDFVTLCRSVVAHADSREQSGLLPW